MDGPTPGSDAAATELEQLWAEVVRIVSSSAYPDQQAAYRQLRCRRTGEDLVLTAPDVATRDLVERHLPRIGAVASEFGLLKAGGALRLELAAAAGDVELAPSNAATAEHQRAFRAPGALILGDGALAPMMGRQFGGARRPGERWELQPQLDHQGRVRQIVIESKERQLALFTPHAIQLVNPTPEQIADALAYALDNGVWRFLLCCMAAAEEDEVAGRVAPGACLYTPSRFAAMHGIAQHMTKRGARFHASHVRRMDRMMESLGLVGFRATVRLGGHLHQLVADKLVYYAEVHVRRAGRRRASLYRVNDALRKLVEPKSGAAWFPLATRALAPPAGVAQETWDDAFKLFSLLGAKARYAAHLTSTSRDLPWSWSLENLVEKANVTAQSGWKETRRRGLQLLEALERRGLIRWRVEGEGRQTHVLYDVPDLREALKRIKSPSGFGPALSNKVSRSHL